MQPGTVSVHEMTVAGNPAGRSFRARHDSTVAIAAFGRISNPFRPPRALAPAVAAAFLVAGCMGALPVATPSAQVPTGSPDAAVLATRAQLETALKADDFGLIDYRQPYVPPETPALAAAPRSTFQVVLPADPGHGVVVVYDLRDPAAATAAGAAYAAYLGSGPIRVSFPPDTRFVLRQLGSTLVLFTWSQANSPDRTGSQAADAIETLGTGFLVP